jgi:hypothetical protein
LIQGLTLQTSLDQFQSGVPTIPRRQLLLVCLPIFTLALTVRFLTWQDNRYEIWKVQTSVTDGYKDSARQLVAGDLGRFVEYINHMGHSPGYVGSAKLVELGPSSYQWLRYLRIPIGFVQRIFKTA